ncbi:MAG: glycoside hydrolase family 3 N-terminal domain-containing protein [Rhizorhabdus sp.]
MTRAKVRNSTIAKLLPTKGFDLQFLRKSGFAACIAFACCSVILPARSQQMSSARMSDEAVARKVDALVVKMTPEEKAAQLTQYFYLQPFPQANTKAFEALATTGVGSLLFATDPNEINRLQRIAVEQSRLHIPVLFAFDVIHGLKTIFPVPIGMAASWDPSLVESIQAASAREARAIGVHWAFAPMLDIARDPRWGRIVEGSGEDPYLTSVMGVAQVRGFQGPYIGAPGHIIAGPKHFVGYGASLGGRDYAEANISESELWNTYLPPFEAAIRAGAGNVMSAYMGLNSVPAASNRWLLTEVLRNTWGFKGFVVSDSGGVSSLKTQGVAANDEDAAVAAIKAGLTMEMTGPVQTPAMAALPRAMRNGRVTAAEVDRAVRHVLEMKIRMGLFERPYIDVSKVGQVLANPQHLELARIAAERSAVLVRNDRNVLPLNRDAVRSLAVVGPLADSKRDTLGSWAFAPNEPPSMTVLEGIRKKLGAAVRVDYSEGVRIPPRFFPAPGGSLDKKVAKPPLDEAREIAHAVDLANSADATILVLGETQDMSGETASRTTFELAGRQRELMEKVIATGKPVVVVLMSARPVDLGSSNPPTVLDVWYPGSQGGAAVANLVFGDSVPGGKLPFTWINDAAQSPNPYNYLISHKPKDAEKGYFNESSVPAYPFGYGLSYTTFGYANVTSVKSEYRKGEPVQITAEITNTGARAGEEVVQLYIHQRLASVQRPVRELKGFERIALKPGEKRTVSFTLTNDDLRYWNAATRSWVNEASAYDVWVGGSSNAKDFTTFEVR